LTYSRTPWHDRCGDALSVVRTLALELAAVGIRVNAVAPGAVAATVLFLLSDMADYITDQCLVVDAGRSLKWSIASAGITATERQLK
jgi:NAD(P)-dependent dehydrogenase (short-subunit alcohol dehydrogenase family)